MNFISNFYKFIVIILLIIILIKVINNLFETFTTSVVTSTSDEEKIKFNLIKNNNNSVDITWNNNSEVTKYVIVKYINNTGPYIKVINGDTNKYTINEEPVTTEMIASLKQTNICLENYIKPLRSISTYKIDELNQLAERLEIEKHQKPKMYELINAKLQW